jgi:hypothetical protein
MKDPGVAFQALEEEVNTFKKVDERLVARRNILHGLIVGRHMNAQKNPAKRHTLRRTQIPVNIVLAGENG